MVDRIGRATCPVLVLHYTMQYMEWRTHGCNGGDYG